MRGLVMRAAILCSLVPLLAACTFGGADTDLCAEVSCSGLGTCVDLGDRASCECNEGYVAEGLACVEQVSGGYAQILVADIHATEGEQPAINLRSMQTGDLDDFDFVLYEDERGEIFELAEGVEGINMGSSLGFHDLIEAPDEGYAPDGLATEEMCIGTSFQSGGSCHSGFTMSGNVYVLKLADGSFAKVEVISFFSGRSELRVYRQVDGKNLETIRD
ncbi:MAG: hypothetical protein JRF33_16820 [Deltaproteobacteria bacterium]|nr:hypothetical protein [Deltaproteobacteria bacterium]